MLFAGQFVADRQALRAAPRCSLPRVDLGDGATNFRVTARHDNYTELAPDDRPWHLATSHSSFDKLGLRPRIRGTFMAVAQSANQKPVRAKARVYCYVNTCAAAHSFAEAAQYHRMSAVSAKRLVNAGLRRPKATGACCCRSISINIGADLIART
jgi:hypothetical protein